MAQGVSPSSSASEQTTFASSRAVTVRAGALACNRRRLRSAREAGRSTTTGTVVEPCSRQRSRRLKPSTTSKEPSSWGTTRSGISDRGSPRAWPAPRRSLARRVRSRSMGSQRRLPAGSRWGSGIGLPSQRQGRNKGFGLPRSAGQKGVGSSVSGRCATTRRCSSLRYCSCSTLTRRRAPWSRAGAISSPG